MRGVPPLGPVAALLGCCGPLVAAAVLYAGNEVATPSRLERSADRAPVAESVTDETLLAAPSSVEAAHLPVDPVAPAAVQDVVLTPPPPPVGGGEVLHRGSRDRRTVALTFDDGPSSWSTRRVLAILAQREIPATFFVLGRAAERDATLLVEIAAGGHAIGNHAHSHTSFRSLFPSQIVSELDRTAAAVEAATGKRPRFVRPPYGRFPESSIALLRDRGEDIVLWSVDANDWAAANPEAIAEGVVAAVTPGSVILLHDTAPATVAALPLVLDGLARRRFTVVPLADLLERPAYAESD